MKPWTNYLGHEWNLRVVLICLAGIFVNCLLIGPGLFTVAYPGANDFQHFYLGAKLAGSADLYDIQKISQAQHAIYGENHQFRVPNRLPFYYIFLSPLARLPYHPAWMLWLGATAAACFGFVTQYPRKERTELAVMCCWSYPLLLSLAIGQDLAFILLILAVVLRAFEQQRCLLAGLVLSLCSIKFHFFFLLPLLFLGRREKRAVVGFVLGLAMLAALSFVVQGPAWPFAYVSIALSPVVNAGDSVMPNLHGWVNTLRYKLVLEAVLSLAVIAMAWRVIRRGTFEVGFAVTLLGGLLLSHHAYPADCAILIPALLVFTRPPFGLLVRGLAGLLLLPSTYIFLLVQGPLIPVALMMFLLAAVMLDSSQSRSLSKMAQSQVGG